jgi:DNA polymerase I-like protein with 3'-5' exonuclease and polymerase domains
MIEKRGTDQLQLKQMKSLLKASEKDGKWHASYQLVKTATGRLAGGEGESASKSSTKLNPQGLARKFKPLMECIVADEGQAFVSIDLSAGEPTVISHYSKDPNYFAACFGMVGKQPYMREDGLLMISDIYLMGASVSPTGRDVIRAEFEAGAFDGWVEDEEKVKARPALKKVRKGHKDQILGLGYEMGPEKMVKQARDKGVLLNLTDAKEFRRLYWDVVFPEVKRTKLALQKKFTADGYLVNRFGFLLRPDKKHECFNYFIQSTISGMIYAIIMLIKQRFPDLKLEGIIHDELIIQVPIAQLDDLKKAVDEAVQFLNNQMKWSVDIRTGWAPGTNFYEAK